MSNRPTFQINGQHANTINNVGRDFNISSNSLTEEMLKLIDALKYEINKLNIDDKNKTEITNLINKANIELEKKSPNKNSVVESIKKMNEILKETKIAGESLKDIGVLVSKAAGLLGCSVSLLGWHF